MNLTFHFNSNVVFKENVDYFDLYDLVVNRNKIMLVQHYNGCPFNNPFDADLRYVHGGLWGGQLNKYEKCLLDIHHY